MKQYFQICTCITTFKTAWVTKWFLVLNFLLLWICQYEKDFEWYSQKVILKWRNIVSVETYIFLAPVVQRVKSTIYWTIGNPWIICLGIYPKSNFGLNSLSLTIYYCNSCYPYHCHNIFIMIIGVLCVFHSLLLSTTIIIGLKFVVHQVKFLDLRCSHFPKPLAVSINRKAFCNVHAKLFLRVPIIFSSHLSRRTWAWCYCRYRWFYQIAVKELHLCDLFESMILVHLQMEEFHSFKMIGFNNFDT